ncbi:hypothetical protein ACH4TV_47845 [Streptomyces sp. NPDC020898]|uniref:hypothetical protein n=1 Tax=Streptomyces sp. NPDC020898 TaxID=3365101 RepID=UPI0037A4A648
MVKPMPRRRRAALSVLAWWTALTFTLWLLSQTLDQPAQLAPCAASAALLVTIGETGDWLRRRWHARRQRERSSGSASVRP